MHIKNNKYIRILFTQSYNFIIDSVNSVWEEWNLYCDFKFFFLKQC